MKLGGRKGKNLEKKYTWRTYKLAQIFSLYGSYASKCNGLRVGLQAAAANHLGKNGLCQAFAQQRGDGNGAGKDGVTIRIES